MSKPSSYELANAIRALSMDAVQKANSGHPGMPMGMADIAEVLWNHFLSHDPLHPQWPNRDRFVLSNGHGSMLLYSLLHLTGYPLSIEDLKAFRQLHSSTPGHPEYGHTVGVETTTGPLGQGLANGVGMALAERMMAAQFNQPEFQLIDHFTYVFVGDGCLMEGISHEACSLAGVLKLGKLIVLYDDNHISIDGEVEGWFQDNTPQRFESYGWQVIPNIDGHNPAAVHQALEMARQEENKPTLICCKTTIGYGAPNAAGKEECHGAPLGVEEITAARATLQWPYAPFEIPEAIYKAWDARPQGKIRYDAWEQLFSSYEKKHPALAKEFQRRQKGALPSQWLETAKAWIKECQNNPKDMATRKASLECINHFGGILPELMGGSADLTGSNLTFGRHSKTLSSQDFSGNYLHYGVREFAMSALCNGIALYGGFIPYCGTFLTFSDYARNALRLSAMMQQRVIFIYTHDSIGLGEDGPTHQPIEHAAMLRLTPHLTVWRPCDLTETAVAWRCAVEHNTGPSCLLLSRQVLPHQTRDEKTLQAIERGGYILAENDPSAVPDLILIATGSEVQIAMKAFSLLVEKGLQVRVVSMPSTTIFDQQDVTYQHTVLPPQVKNRIAIEAASKDFWYKYVGLEGAVVGLSRYGYSAPYEEAFKELGITVDVLLKEATRLVKKNAEQRVVMGE